MGHHAMTHNTGTPAGVAFVAGISAGALAALLFAPRPGTETRRQLKDAAINARRKAQETVQDKKNKVEVKVDKALDEADQVMQDSSATIETMAEKNRRGGPKSQNP